MLSETKLLPRIKTFVLLDLIGDKNIKIDKDGNSSGELQEIVAKAGKTMGESARVYKYTSATTDDHEVFRGYGVPSVLLIDFYNRVPPERMNLKPGQTPPPSDGYEQWWHTDRDTVDKMSASSLAFAGNLVMQALPDFEAFILKTKR